MHNETHTNFADTSRTTQFRNWEADLGDSRIGTHFQNSYFELLSSGTEKI